MENSNPLSLKSLSSDEINKIEEFRKAKHTAVLSILFSDIVNSTLATENLGEQTYSKLRHIHDELFKRIMSRDNAGVIIKEIGDSFLCVFAEPSTAVIRAIEFQRALLTNKDNLTVQNYTLTVRIGIHVGQVAIENSLALDIFGRHVNRAARIEAIANGGQTLTSLSAWENAVGWLKDNNEENLGWISYGKVKLKGIDERVDIFGFYPNETGKPAVPKIIRNRNVNRTLLLLAVFFIMAATSIVILKKVVQYNHPKENILLPSGRKSYYIQFDFSEITKQVNSTAQKPFPDTLNLSEILLTQIITVLNPDSVITEADLMHSFSRKGKLYARHADEKTDAKYFKDTLGFYGVLFIKAEVTPPGKKDSVRLAIKLVLYESDSSTTTSADDAVFSFQNIEKEFRSNIQDRIMSTRLWTVQGYVLSSNDSIVLFRITKESTLREGTAIEFARGYSDKKGIRQRLEEIQKRIDYYQGKRGKSSVLKNYLAEYAEKEKQLSIDSIKSDWSQGIDLRGKVTELYDTTGKAVWNLSSDYPYEKPKPGDIIYFEQR